MYTHNKYRHTYVYMFMYSIYRQIFINGIYVYTHIFISVKINAHLLYIYSVSIYVQYIVYTQIRVVVADSCATTLLKGRGFKPVR